MWPQIDEEAVERKHDSRLSRFIWFIYFVLGWKWWGVTKVNDRSHVNLWQTVETFDGSSQRMVQWNLMVLLSELWRLTEEFVHCLCWYLRITYSRHRLIILYKAGVVVYPMVIIINELKSYYIYDDGKSQIGPLAMSVQVVLSNRGGSYSLSHFFNWVPIVSIFIIESLYLQSFIIILLPLN